MKQICESCGKTIAKPEIAFRLKVEMYADPSPPEFTTEDLERDAGAELRELYEQLSGVDPQEAEDEVHESYLFTLCGACRLQAHNEFRKRQLPFEQQL
ncbi:MAG TPA: hypothetical protein PLA90_14875 [Candidatus Sumerlaeota bacterium]|mgnify:CR=1 FL=1|nr:hypothetical protein [Candidatus Sumerlaeota bacterium]HPS02820.1 hypothetical protein [Candidatus Sumerlaeota bacterium]